MFGMLDRNLGILHGLEGAAGPLDLLRRLAQIIDPDADMMEPDKITATLVAGVGGGNPRQGIKRRE